MATFIKTQYHRYTDALPSHIGATALLSGAISFVGMYATRRDPKVALLAMAVGQIASLIDSAIRPLFDRFFFGEHSAMATAFYLAVKTGTCIVAAATLFQPFGIIPACLNLGGQVLINSLIAGIWSLCSNRSAIPYSIGA